MKNQNIKNKLVFVNKIVFISISLIIIQLCIPIIGNISLMPVSNADEVVLVDGNVTYKKVKDYYNNVYAEISDINATEINIKDRIEVKERNAKGKYENKNYEVKSYRIINGNSTQFYFGDFKKLKKLAIPIRLLYKYNNPSFNLYVFKNVSSLETLELIGYDQKKYYTTYLPKLNANYLPMLKDLKNLKNVILDSKITEIGDNLFQGCSNLEHIKVEGNLKSIGNYCFKNCKKLIDIKGGSVTKIGNGAFYCCENLEYVNIGSIDKIGDNAFYKCSKFKGTISYGGYLKYIGKSAFEDCKSFNNNFGDFTANSKLEYLGARAFYNSGITNIHLNGSLTKIEDYTFANCDKLETIKISAPIKTIGKCAFENVKSYYKKNYNDRIRGHLYIGIEPLELPNSLKTIETKAFNNITLFEIKVPSSVNKIVNKNAFAVNTEEKSKSKIKCEKNSYTDQFLTTNHIEHVTYVKPVTNVNSFQNKDFKYEVISNKNVKILKYIGGNKTTIKVSDPFYNMIAYVITEISTDAFKGASIQTIDLSSLTSLTAIKAGAFSNTKKLNAIYLPASVKNIDNTAFNNSGIKTIYGKNSSFAKTFAERKKITFKSIDNSSSSNKTNSNNQTNSSTNLNNNTTTNQGKSNSNNQQINVDKESPIKDELKITYQNSNYKKATIKWKFHDNGSGIYGWKIIKQEKIWYTGYNKDSNGTGEKDIFENGTYYFYIIDKNNNPVCYKFTINKIDTARPKAEILGFIHKDSKTYIKFNVSDNGAHDSGIKKICIINKSTNETVVTKNYKYGKVQAVSLDNVEIKKSGKYYVCVYDFADHITNSTVKEADAELPSIMSYSFPNLNTQGTKIDKYIYLKNLKDKDNNTNSKLTIQIRTSEDIKTGGGNKNKIRINNLNATVKLLRVNDRTFNIVIDNIKDINKVGTISIAEGFLTDKSGNKSKASNALNSIRFSVDGTIPVVDLKYEYTKVSAKITDNVGIKNYKWKIYESDGKTLLWSSKLEEMKENKKELNLNLSLGKYEGKWVMLYVKDVSGNYKTYKSIIRMIDSVEKNDSKITFKVVTTQKAYIDSNNVSQYANNSKINLQLTNIEKRSDDYHFNVIIDMHGVTGVNEIVKAENVMYYVENGNRKYFDLFIPVETTAPTAKITLKEQEENNNAKLKFEASDSNSGIYKYIIERVYDDENKQPKKILERKVINEKNVEIDYSVTATGKIRFTVFDKCFNKTSKIYEFK